VLIAARWLLAASLRPVVRMTRQAADWSEHDLDHRFALGTPHDELTELAATLDGLLDRLAASLRHQRRFSAELPHELRAPPPHARCASASTPTSRNGSSNLCSKTPAATARPRSGSTSELRTRASSTQSKTTAPASQPRNANASSNPVSAARQHAKASREQDSD